ncbi:MAG TPA: putative toxin-antitoxin system toxin component, PIN family [Gammaproteobacteria bacterium]|nr:putative toxin-antitoxin system toxin component, PIN family [Gammaproteobacteria bacterium]
MRVVLDTNVLISGLMLPDSIPGKIIHAWRNAHFVLALSEPMLEEITKVLAYPKIQKRLLWDQSQINKFDLLLRFKTDIVSLESIEAHVPTDPDDNMVLATFLASQADYLISGDSDLLNLNTQYAILSPSEFAKQL